MRVLLVLAFRVHDGQAAAEVPVLLLFLLRLPLLFLRLDVKPQAVQIFQSPFSHQNSISFLEASTVARRLHCSPGGFLRTGQHSSNPYFVPTRCSSDEASRSHQQPLIHLFVSLAARTSWSGINANTGSPNMHKGDAYGAANKYLNGVLPSSRTVNLESTNPSVPNCKWNGKWNY